MAIKNPELAELFEQVTEQQAANNVMSTGTQYQIADLLIGLTLVDHVDEVEELCQEIIDRINAASTNIRTGINTSNAHLQQIFDRMGNQIGNVVTNQQTIIALLQQIANNTSRIP